MTESQRRGIIDTWHKEEASWITPDMKVWAVRLADGLLFDYAYTGKGNAQKYCWWFNDKEFRVGIQLIPMEFKHYLKIQFEEAPGMNPFWALGRLQFMLEMREKYGENLREV